MLPLHQISITLGPAVSKVLVKAHILTGEDVMSKFGTKHAAYLMDPLKYLQTFGENPHPSFDEIALVEEYLVRVYEGVRNKPIAKTFNALRLETYVRGKVGINDLPPTSHTVHDHIHRGLFLIYNVCNLLNPDAHELDPAVHSEHFSFIFHQIMHNEIISAY